MPLVQSFSHVTQRQSLKLLGEVLLDRANFNVMTRYIADEENLKLVMNMLRSKSKNIQFEAFHVFKVRRLSIRFFFQRVRRLCLDFRGQSQEAASDRNDTPAKQGEIVDVFQRLSE